MTLGITTERAIPQRVTAVYPVQVNREEITAAVMSFLGEQLQTPPMYRRSSRTAESCMTSPGP